MRDAWLRRSLPGGGIIVAPLRRIFTGGSLRRPRLFFTTRQGGP
jgi:hypothetical protein